MYKYILLPVFCDAMVFLFWNFLVIFLNIYCMCYSSRPQIIVEEDLFGAASHAVLRNGEELPIYFKKSSYEFTYVFPVLSGIWFSFQFTRQYEEGGEKWIKQEFQLFRAFPVNLPQSWTVTLVVTCHQTNQSPSIPSPDFLPISFYFLLNNLNRVSYTLYHNGWINILLALFACLGSLMCCPAESFLSVSSKTENYSSTVSELI